MKKATKSLIWNIIILAFTLFGLILYIANCNSIYFKKFGVNTSIILFIILALVVEIALLIIAFIKENKFKNILSDAMSIIIPIFVILAVAYLLDARIYYAATILTYEKTNQNVQDLIPALVSLGSLLTSFILSIVFSFITKKDN